MPIRIKPTKGEERKHWFNRCYGDKHVRLAAQHKVKSKDKAKVNVVVGGICKSIWDER